MMKHHQIFSFPPRTPHQLPGAPYSVTVMLLCPETYIYPYHLAPQGITRRMGTATLMVQSASYIDGPRFVAAY